MRSRPLLALLMLVGAAGCVDAGPHGEGPGEVVAALHAEWIAGDLEAMHSRVAYRVRLAEQLGEVWRDGPEVDRARAEAMMRDMFVRTLERYWDEHVAGHPLVTTTRWQGPEVAWVRVATPLALGPAPKQGPQGFAWRYRLERLDGVWMVTQREFELGFARSETSRFYPMAVRRIGADYGRTPTLAELNANLPSLMGRMRQRAFRLDAAIP